MAVQIEQHIPNAALSSVVALPIFQDLPFKKDLLWGTPDGQIVNGGKVEKLQHTGKAETFFLERGATKGKFIVSTSGGKRMYDARSAGGELGYSLGIDNYNALAATTQINFGGVMLRFASSAPTYTIFSCQRQTPSIASMLELNSIGASGYQFVARRHTGGETIATTGTVALTSGAWYPIWCNVDFVTGQGYLENVATAAQTPFNIPMPGTGFPTLSPTAFEWAIGGRPASPITLTNVTNSFCIISPFVCGLLTSGEMATRKARLLADWNGIKAIIP